MKIKIILEDCSLKDVQNLFGKNTISLCEDDRLCEDFSATQKLTRKITTKSDEVPQVKYELTPSIKAGERSIVNDEGEVVNPATDEPTELVEKTDTYGLRSRKAQQVKEEVVEEVIEDKPKRSTRSSKAISVEETETVEEENSDEYEHFRETYDVEETEPVEEEEVVGETKTVEETVDETIEETTTSETDIDASDDYEKYIEDFDDTNV